MDMIERGAVAIQAAAQKFPETSSVRQYLLWSQRLAFSRAVIKAMREPTEEMVEAGCQAAQDAGLLAAHTGKDDPGGEPHPYGGITEPHRGPFFHILQKHAMPAMIDAALKDSDP